jgi:hypothetical protein
METLLMVAVVLITLAVIAQAGVLIGMYLTSRRLSAKAEILIEDGRRLKAPMETITSNLKTVSVDLSESANIVKQQARQTQESLAELRMNVRDEVEEVRERVLSTVEELRAYVTRPAREYSAIASGVAEGVRTFFGFGRKRDAKDEDRSVA